MSENYAVLARKYRSQDFKSLIGQDVLVKTLTTAIKTGRIAHAYMLTGIRGTGKTSTARILAKALNCKNGPTADPCCECEDCTAIANSQHIDVIELDAASQTGVDNMRELLDSAAYRPTNGRYKVFIIDEVHMLSKPAFNAMLKTLEEPPPHVIFILATTDINKVPITVLSRCQRFDLARISAETLKKHMQSLAKLEKVDLADDAAEMLAQAADGSARDGLSMLDQAIAQTGGKVTGAAVQDMLKRADRGAVQDFMETVLSGDVARALQLSDDFYSGGADMQILLHDMMEWTHWATRMHPVLKMGANESAPYSPDLRTRMMAAVSGTSLNALSRMWQVMSSSVSEMASVGNQKQSFDMLIVRMINIADIPPLSELIDKYKNTPQISPIQNSINNEVVKKIYPAPTTEPIKDEELQNVIIDSAADLESALVKDKQMMLASGLAHDVEILEFEPNRIKFAHRGNDREFKTKLGKWLLEKTGTDWALDMSESRGATTMDEEKKAKATADPMIAAAMDLFPDAEITGVK